MSDDVKTAKNEYDILRSVMDIVSETVPPAAARSSARARMPSVEPGRQTGWMLPGFAAKTRITTAFGDLPIEALRLRDEVRTTSGRMLRVAWIDKIKLDQSFLEHHPEALPVMIRANALEHGKPVRDLLVSPNQVLSMGLANFQIKFVPAEDIRGRTGVFRKPEFLMTYYMFHCGEPTTVLAEGVAVQVNPLHAAPDTDDEDDDDDL